MTGPPTGLPEGEAERVGDGGAGYVLVRIGASHYGVAMADVGEIGRSPQVTRVPGVPAFVAGMANWRGSALAVLDARTLLGVAADQPAGHLVVVRRDDVEVGLLVDAVEGVIIPDGAPGPVPGSVAPEVARLLAGTVLDDAAGPVAVLEPAALVALRDRLR